MFKGKAAKEKRIALHKRLKAVPARCCAWVRRVVQWRHWKRILPVLCLLLSFGVALLGMCLALSGAMCHRMRARIVTPEQLSGEFDYVIVLGCKVHDDGRLSDRLRDRVQVGVELHQKGVGDVLLMSGDRQDDGEYDEVGAMRAAAIQAGVEEEKIMIDPRGYSTYESLVRLLRLYQGKRVVIVTQTYHLYRALYIAERLGIDAYGVSADLRPFADEARCQVREVFARVKDLWYTQIRPDVSLEP